MLKRYDPETARQTILKRTPLDDMEVPVAVIESLQKLFGEPLTPDQAVQRILRDVRTRGDTALREWTTRLDGQTPQSFRISPDETRTALKKITPAQREALELAADRIRRFHQAQPVTSWMTNQLGGTLGQFIRPIRRVGVYVPGGSAPLPSSVLMSVVPAQVAGVQEIVVVAPPQRGTGQIAPIILAACALVGVEEVYALGGAQAIAALAFGTESIPRVDKIFGPGNLFVTLAKKQVYGVVGIDGLAGPTETLVIADETANPEWVAADLLAQAEHDVLASAILLTPSATLAEQTALAVARQLEQRSRAEVISQSLANRSGAVVTRDLDEAVMLANEYAPEHLCLAVRDPWRLAERIHAAGGVFLGEHSFEVLGDYVAGPSHVMPTGGSARFASPLNVLDFIHIVSLIALDETTTRQIAPKAAEIAHAEGLDAHAFSAEVRL
ncbi:histidinol dehydrogenase [Anaerolinea thermolimosa]|uniref:histidinol dehydrogenase n=1 Tax=Anaerolinea thermolimosa TaxID=229919 RepID=UPI00078667C2|nr:histidinol dehydrogenase [Anaerolinea thermolimosa]GAP07230.1 histidinol dehydrogenase [Anaerolinea thermolimosa]